jgi:DNA-binding beta-propeller fold protein YncE
MRDTREGVVSLLDSTTLSVRSVLRGFGEPRYTAVHPSERLAYVTDSARGDVATVDLVRGTIVGRTPVPGPARHVSVDHDGRVLWTALGTRAERIAVLDLRDARRPRLRGVVTPPFLAHDVVFAPDGRVWVTSGSRGAIARYPRGGGAPRVLTADAPPQHVGFAVRRAFVASGVDGILRVQRLDGSRERATRIPRGSYNVTFGSPPVPGGRPAVVTPSLDQGTLCVLSPSGGVRFVRDVARSAHDACLVEAA